MIEKINYKIFYQFECELTSPMSIGGSYSNETDHDVICDNKRNPFIPASTLCGCLFSKQDNAFKYYQISKKDIKKSNLFISDGILENVEIGRRDGNSLNYDTKTALNTAKFDYQCVERGATLKFFVEYTSSNNFSIESNEIDQDIKDIIMKINAGYYRIGFKQNRGFGAFSVKKIYRKIFDYKKINLKEFIEFNKNICETLKVENMEDYTELMKADNYKLECDSFVVELVSPLMIGSPSALKYMADKSQLIEIIGKDGYESAIIPATSINGAIRSRACQLAKIKGIKELKFPKYVIDEVYVKGKLLYQTRTKVDRFTGAAADKALFDENIFIPFNLYENKSQPLTFKIRFISVNTEDERIAKKYMLEAFNMLETGLLAIGGETSIGRGVFKKYEEGENDYVCINI